MLFLMTAFKVKIDLTPQALAYYENTRTTILAFVFCKSANIKTYTLKPRSEFSSEGVYRIVKKTFWSTIILKNRLCRWYIYIYYGCQSSPLYYQLTAFDNDCHFKTLKGYCSQ